LSPSPRFLQDSQGENFMRLALLLAVAIIIVSGFFFVLRNRRSGR
jgi:hypothetical protein